MILPSQYYEESLYPLQDGNGEILTIKNLLLIKKDLRCFKKWKIDNYKKGIPQSEFETIAWTKKPSWEEFRADIDKIVFDMINCS